MPTETLTPKQVLSHCVDPRCKGSAQRAVQGVEVLTEFTYRERGGEHHGVEMSTVRFRWPDDTPESARRCKECQKPLELADQVRPTYEPLSGQPQDGLLRVDRWSPGGRSADVEELVDKLTEKLGG